MSDDLTTETEPLIDLDALEALAAAVGDRPRVWEWSGRGDEGYPQQVISQGDATLIAECYEGPQHPSTIAAYIAGMNPVTTLELVSEVRKGREASSHFDTLMGFMVRLAEVAGELPPSSLVDGVEDLVDATITKMVTGDV